MKLYIYIDQFEQDELEQEIVEAVSKWAESEKTDYQLVHQSIEDHPELSFSKIGIQFDAKKKLHLKTPLNYLNSLAKKYKLEFVVGAIDADGNEEDYCYFGYEEGRPDMYEIGSYLDLK